MEQNQKGSKAYLISIVMVAVLGGLLFGYDTAVISGAEKGLQAFFKGANDFEYSDFMHGFTSSSALIGCIIGSSLSGLFASNFGRKRSLIFAGICFFLSAWGSMQPESYILPQGQADWTLLVVFNFYRVLGGIGVGMASAICTALAHYVHVLCILAKSHQVMCAVCWLVGTSLPLSSVSWWFTSSTS